MRGVIVMEDDDIAVSIVSADVAPIERIAANENGEQRRDATANETTVDSGEPHPYSDCSERRRRCQRGRPGLVEGNDALSILIQPFSHFLGGFWSGFTREFLTW
jgi:hypothetical protein